MILWLTGLSAEKQQRLVNAQKMIKDLDTRNLPKLVHTIGFNPALYQEWLRLDEKKWKTDLLRFESTLCEFCVFLLVLLICGPPALCVQYESGQSCLQLYSCNISSFPFFQSF